MIVVTGAAGFIGSCLVRKLNDEGLEDLILVDDFSNKKKSGNLIGKKFSQQIHRDDFINWLQIQKDKVKFIYHIGARTDTTEFNVSIFNKLNLDYSKAIWNCCSEYKIPLVYASSAATYGAGESGYDDDESLIPKLKPLNPYGDSKNEFDKWVLHASAPLSMTTSAPLSMTASAPLSMQKDVALSLPKSALQPPFWAGLKFFNVYGPNEYHKERMASVIFHAFNQVNKTGKVRLFRSHRPEYKDGWQLRDFVYVKDVIDVCYFLYSQRTANGIFNLGSGTARSFYDLAAATFKAMNRDINIEYIDIPGDIRDKYQYFTEAKMQKLRSAGYDRPFYTLENGVFDYVKNYLIPNCYF